MTKLTFKIEIAYDDEDEAELQAGAVEADLNEWCSNFAQYNTSSVTYNVTAE